MKKGWKHLAAISGTPVLILILILVLGIPMFIVVAFLLGSDWDEEFFKRIKDCWLWGCWSFKMETIKAGIEPAWRIAVVLGGAFGLWLAVDRGKTADRQVSTAQKQVDESIKQTRIAFRSNHAQRYEKASEMLWHPKDAGMRVAGCHALNSLGRDGDFAMAVQCCELLISFIRDSAPTLIQEKANQAKLSRRDIIEADQALSSLHQEWSRKSEFLLCPLKGIPRWFWGKIEDVPIRKYPGADLSKATLYGVDFSNAILSDANLTGAGLSNRDDLIKVGISSRGRANFNRADLSRANFSETDLSKTDFMYAILSDADLSGVGLNGANLSSANLTGACLSNGANLSGANFTNADLTRAKLTYANLSSANLYGVNLSSADLTYANLNGANLYGVNLSETDFKGDGSNNQAAKNLTPEQVESAFWVRNIGKPVLPDYLDGKIDLNKFVREAL